MTRRHESILWLALLALAALLRFGPVPAGLPYISYVDEGHVLHPAIEILRSGKFDPGQFTYPPLTSYLTIVAAKLYSPVYRLAHDRSLRADLPRHEDSHTELGQSYDLITPSEIIIIGRVVVALLSLGTVALAGAMGKKLGGVRAGLMAMLFAGLCPALVSRGSIAIIDATAAFFATATLYFCLRLRAETRWRDAALAGIAAGLACGGKYTVGIVFVIVCIAILSANGDGTLKVRLGWAAVAGLVVGIFCGVPAVFLQPEKIVAELRAQAVFYQSIRSDQTYWAAALSWSEIGLPLLLAGLVGLGWMVWTGPTRDVALTSLGFAVLLLGIVAWPSFQPFRNLLSLVPLICIWAAFFFERVWLYCEKREIPRVLAIAIVILFALPWAWADGSYLRTRFTHVDSRVRAVDWLQEHAGNDATVLGIRELAISPAEWQRLSGKATVVPWFQAADLMESQRFDYLVTGDFDLRYASDPPRWSQYHIRWSGLESPLPVAITFGVVTTPVVPYLWRTNDEKIIIRRVMP